MECQSLGLLCRYSSRALLIPFKEPSIGPKSTAESLAFANLSRTRKVASRAIGWVISLRKCLVEGGGFREIREMLPTVQEKLPGVDPRLCTGYACLLYFAKKVMPCRNQYYVVYITTRDVCNSVVFLWSYSS